jgi:hypothetical protein
LAWRCVVICPLKWWVPRLLVTAIQRNIANSSVVDGLSANDDAADLAGTY